LRVGLWGKKKGEKRRVFIGVRQNGGKKMWGNKDDGDGGKILLHASIQDSI